MPLTSIFYFLFVSMLVMWLSKSFCSVICKIQDTDKFNEGKIATLSFTNFLFPFMLIALFIYVKFIVYFLIIDILTT